MKMSNFATSQLRAQLVKPRDEDSYTPPHEILQWILPERKSTVPFSRDFPSCQNG